MNKEDAIEYLNEFILFKKISNTTEEEAIECFKLAVKALQQQPSEGEKIIKVRKGTLRLRTGRYVVYDVEWLKEHFNTTEAKIYGQPQPKERTETHACDCISREAVLDGLASIAKVKAKSDAQKTLMGRIMFFIEQLSPVTPQPKQEDFEDCIRRSVIVHPKTGHWIEHKSNGMSYIECSKCSCWFLRMHLTRNSYCPNCGSYNGGTK